MAPNFYIDCPLDKDLLFQGMKERLGAPGLLHEIRALDLMVKPGISPDRLFMVPLLVRKIKRTLSERYAAIASLEPAVDISLARVTQLKADASELIWRTAWDRASHEAQSDRRMASLQTALSALATIDAWLEAVAPNQPKTDPA